MKNWILILGVTAASMASSQAQLLSREALGGALLGGAVGGVIGHNSGGRSGEGIAIGAGSGLLLGALTHSYRRDTGYGGDRSPRGYSSYPAYERVRPNYAVTGAALGGIAGGIIGHNNGGRSLEGAAIGLGAGLLVGGLAENHARRDETTRYAPPPAPVVTGPVARRRVVRVTTQEAPAPESRNVTIINNNYYGGSASPMSQANQLFGR